MSVLAGIAWTLATAAGTLLAYAVASYLLLSYMCLPEGGPYRAVEDAAFVLTLPFVLGVLAVSVARS